MAVQQVLRRRVLLAGTSVAWLWHPRTAHAAAFRLKPDQPPIEPDSTPVGEQLRLTFGDAASAILLPASRATLLPRLPVAGRELLAVTFAADTPDTTADVLAIIGWDGATMRVLALAPMRWHGGTARYGCQASATPDRMGVRLACLASVPRSSTMPFHEAWTSRLDWRDGAPLTPASAAHPPSGFQARILVLQARTLDYLSTPCRDVTAATVAALGLTDPLGLSASAAEPDSMTGH